MKYGKIIDGDLVVGNPIYLITESNQIFNPKEKDFLENGWKIIKDNSTGDEITVKEEENFIVIS